MLAAMLVLAFAAFAAIYPLCFFTQSGQPIRGTFNRFQLAITCGVAGLGAVPLYFMLKAAPVRILMVVWLVGLAAVTAWHWKREFVREWLVALPSIPGMVAILWSRSRLLAPDGLAWLSIGMGAVALALAVFCLAIGYWSLHVRSMSSRHLSRASQTLGLALLVRLIWDLVTLSSERVMYQGHFLSLWSFCAQDEGFFLGLAILAGTLAPLVMIAWVLKHLRARAPESAGGLLYVITFLILMGELSYRYYSTVYHLTL